MKVVGIVGTATLSMLLALAVPAMAQDPKPDQKNDQDRPAEPRDAKPAPKADRPAEQPPRPEGNERRENENQPRQEERQQQMDRRDQNEQNRAQEQNNRGQQQHDQMQREQNQDRQEQHAEQQEHRGQQQAHREPTHGRRIPEERFRATFGREHHFHISRPVIVEGAPQFVYSGYTFVLVDPWPAEWAYTDDLYVDYIDDTYYLCDAYHPGIQIALFING